MQKFDETILNVTTSKYNPYVATGNNFFFFNLFV